jgi:tetratricopeptide (TPR) repeat protein
MFRQALWLIGPLLAASAAAGAAEARLRDLHFGEALYYAHQGYYFDALERLDAEMAQHFSVDEPELDSLHHHLGDATFSVGDFELYYRMHHRAGRAITSVLEGDVDDAVRNEAAYRLARIHFQKNQMDDALHALDRIRGRIPERIRDDIEFLRANIYMATDRPAEAAEVLRRLQGSKDLRGFSSYNLGIALLQNGQVDEAVRQLDRAGNLGAADRSAFAIRDKANLVLGTLLLESGRFEDARRPLQRVRLEGPFSNQALLSAGWADTSADRFERAIVPWSLLAERESTDASVQEAKLALPYAYSQLNVHSRAALLYGQALDAFGLELEKLDASMRSIRQGKFLKALIREEVRQDKNWVIRLRSLPETPETYYLTELLASHDFQTALQNYLDLEDLRARMAWWQVSFDAFDDVIRARGQYYDPLLPAVDQEFRELDSRMRLRLEQHKAMARRLQGMLTAPRPDFLATHEERELAARIDRLEHRIAGPGGASTEATQQRILRLRGVITWALRTEYHERLTEFDRNVRELQAAIDVLDRQYHAFVRVRQAATHSYVGYDDTIRNLRGRVRKALGEINVLMARQGRMLELVAIDELRVRRERLVNYQNQARFALADSYDRATKAQAAGGQE